MHTIVEMLKKKKEECLRAYKILYLYSISSFATNVWMNVNLNESFRMPCTLKMPK